MRLEHHLIESSVLAAFLGMIVADAHLLLLLALIVDFLVALPLLLDQ